MQNTTTIDLASLSLEEQAEVAAQVERITKEREWPFTVKLRYPVEFAGNTIAALVFQRGQLGYLKGIAIDQVPPSEQLMLLASRLCGQPLKVIESLDPYDSSEVLDIALGFITRCRGAGKTR